MPQQKAKCCKLPCWSLGAASRPAGLKGRPPTTASRPPKTMQHQMFGPKAAAFFSDLLDVWSRNVV